MVVAVVDVDVVLVDHHDWDVLVRTGSTTLGTYRRVPYLRVDEVEYVRSQGSLPTNRSQPTVIERTRANKQSRTDDSDFAVVADVFLYCCPII
jgi:hypothetical protein